MPDKKVKEPGVSYISLLISMLSSANILQYWSCQVFFTFQIMQNIEKTNSHTSSYSKLFGE